MQLNLKNYCVNFIKAKQKIIKIVIQAQNKEKEETTSKLDSQYIDLTGEFSELILTRIQKTRFIDSII